jgi:hypothetical protein
VYAVEPSPISLTRLLGAGAGLAFSAPDTPSSELREPPVPAAQPASDAATAAATTAPAAILWVAAMFRPPSSFSRPTPTTAFSDDAPERADGAVKIA